MSAQFLEILFLAGIAFLIISKFISILGTTDDDDPARRGSFFGEPKGMKDVTGSATETEAADILRIAKKVKKLDDEESDHLKAVFEILPNFDSTKFLKGAKGAFNMLITALAGGDAATMQQLVDKRFIEQFKKYKDIYSEINNDQINSSIVDSYSFGNNIYIKVLFEGGDIKEEWVFTKNINQVGPDWHLSNIER